MDSITKPAISRLIKDECTKLDKNIQISSLIYEETRTILREFIEKLIADITSTMWYTQSKILLEKHVYMALDNVPASNKILKQCLPKGKNKDKCFYFPKESFKKFLRNITRDYNSDIKYSEKALNLIQLASEEYLKNVFRQSLKNTIHSGRITLYSKDLQLALNCKDNSQTHQITKKVESSFADYTPYMKKVMNSIYPGLMLSDDVKQKQNTFINLLAKAIIINVNELLLTVGKTTIDTKSIVASVRMIMKGELPKHAISSGTRSVLKYTQRKSGEKYNTNRVESKCNLLFSVSRTKNMIRQYTKNRLSTNALIFLTSVLEYMSAELNELSGNNARDENKKKVTDKHFTEAIVNDEELRALAKSLGLML